MLLSQFYGNILGMVHLTFNSNCFVHALRLAQPWFNAMGVQKLDGPSQCPDLSPLKYFWNELECRLRNRPSSLPAFASAVMDA
ncbi:hypothetical protein TNCV_1129631 [Trichonephila clavipes]|nr:hypothetical protein TNCV_1129631 [Trichonephila clavipes]